LGNQQVNFIGSLSPSHFPALCSIRLSRFTELETENGSQELIFDTHTKAFDRLLRVVVTYNAKTARKQEKRFQKNLGKTLAELAQVRWATVKDPEAKIREVVSPRLPAFLFSVQGEGTDLAVRLDQSAVKAYRKRFGKNLIFTDREDLPAKDIVQAYRDRNEVEQVFGEMNDPETVPFQPVRHWTDQKIVIHAFICILGLLLFKLLQLKLKRQGITLSLAIIKDELDPIHLQLFVSRSGKLFKIISDRSKLRANMFDLFSLQKIALALGAQHDSS
jgi:transposase